MKYEILNPNEYSVIQIEKWFSGYIKCDITVIDGGKVDILLITQNGYNSLTQNKKINKGDIIANMSSITIYTDAIKVASGFYFLLILNKTSNSVRFNIDLEENREPPIASGIFGTSGMPL